MRIPSGRALEDVDQTVRPASILIRRQLENCAASAEPPPSGRAVEIAGRIEDQAGVGMAPSLPVKRCSTLSVQLPS